MLTVTSEDVICLRFSESAL